MVPSHGMKVQAKMNNLRNTIEQVSERSRGDSGDLKSLKSYNRWRPLRSRR